MERRKSSGYDVAEIKRLAAGREVEILERVAQIPAALLDGKERPCPKCNGKTRFRLLDRDKGAIFCSHCFSENNGDFVSAVRWANSVGFADALTLIGEYLHASPEPATPQKSAVLPQLPKRLAGTWNYTDAEGKRF